MKKFLGFAFAFPFYIYVFGLFIAVPVFNWQYANRHGVVSWILLGEVAATVKAPFWPYFAISKWASKEDPIITKSDTHFFNSKEACNTAWQIVETRDGLSGLSQAQKSQLTELLEKAIAEAKQVDDLYLNAVHTELPKKFHEEYLSSVTDILAGLSNGDIGKFTLATIKYNDYSQWVDDHSKELHFPKR